MGTKVHGKSFLPGFHSMMNLNEDTDSGSWPLYYEDKIFNSRQCYDTFSQQLARDAYSENDKEVVKQTMLRHEAIFRNQVSELHRLYRMQRVLMEELKRQEIHKYPIAVEASHSNALSSQRPSEDAIKMCLIPSVSSVKSACSRASVSGTDNLHSQSHLNFTKLNGMNADNFPTQNGGTLGDRNFMEESKNRKLSRTFDLELPAHEYVDSEEADQIEEENASQASILTNNAYNKNWRIQPDNDVKLFLGADANRNCRGSIPNFASHMMNKKSLADLNQPIQVEEATSSASVNNFLGSTIYQGGGIQGMDASLKQNSSFVGFPGDIFQNTQKADKGEEGRPEWSPYKYKFQSGQSGIKMNSLSQDLGAERFPSTSKTVKTEAKEAHTSPPPFLLPDGNRSETWSGNAVFGVGTSQRNQSIANHNLWGQVAASPMPNQYLVVPEVSNLASPSASSMRRPTSSLTQNLDAVREMHCFNPSVQSSKGSNVSIQSPKLNEGKWHLNNHLRSNSSFGSEVSYRSGSLNGSMSESNASQSRHNLLGFDYLNSSGENNLTREHFENHQSIKYLKGSDWKDVKFQKDMNLNLEALPNGSEEGMIARQDPVIFNGAEKNGDSLGALLPWFRTKWAPVQDSTSASFTHDTVGVSKTEKYSSLGTKKIFGVPILGNKPHDSKDIVSQNTSLKTTQSSIERLPFQNCGKVVLDINLSQEPALSDLGQHPSMEDVVIINEPGVKVSSSTRGHLDLNECARDEEEPLECSIPEDTVKIAHEIDLEVPPCPDTAEAMLLYKFTESELKMPTQLSQCSVMQDPSMELVKVAAEALVTISSCVQNHWKDNSCKLPEASSSLSDSLHWLAEVVSSHAHAGVLDSTSKGKHSSELETYSSDESDYFEKMTLNLEETKMDEDWCKPGELEILKNEETVGPSFTTTRRRRGQARRGRQRKDFQRDILPGIVSLSRHEVTEDLQTIGGLMRATGHPWQTALERRNAARNGWARGRRRSRGGGSSSISPVTVVATCLPTHQQIDIDNNNNNSNNNNNNNELGIEERSLKGWGKTTRRPRCQRFLAGNPPSLPSTQV